MAEAEHSHLKEWPEAEQRNAPDWGPRDAALDFYMGMRVQPSVSFHKGAGSPISSLINTDSP